MSDAGIRVRELAQKAGVSEKLVSLLRNKPKGEHGVSDTSISKVINAFNKETGRHHSRENLGL